MSKSIKFASVILLTLFFLTGCDSKIEQINALDHYGFLHGDINLNGFAYEAADAVLYSNCFIYGSHVLTVDPVRQIAASDVNKDGKTLTVSDFVFTTLTMRGRSPASETNPDTVAYQYDSRRGRLSIEDNKNIGTAFAIAKGYQEPILLAANMKMEYVYDVVSNQTRILVYSFNAQTFNGDALQLDDDLVYLELATPDGRPVVTIDVTIKDIFHLYQWPYGPLVDSVTIVFAFNQSAEADFFIRNESGRIVYFDLGTFYSAGVHEFVWYGKDRNRRPLPNGSYFLTLVVEEEEKTIEVIIER